MHFQGLLSVLFSSTIVSHRMLILWMFSYSVFHIMSQATVTTTTPPLTILCSRAMIIAMMIMLALTYVGQTTLRQHNVVLPPWLILRDKRRGSVGLNSILQQQPHMQMPPQTYANYAMAPPQASFSFRFYHPTNSLSCVGVCCIVCFLLSGSYVGTMFTIGGSTIGVSNTSEHTLGRHMWLLVKVHDPHRECTI